MKWLIAVVAIIVIAGGGFLVYNNMNDDSSSDDNLLSSTQDESTELTSIKALIARGGNAKCTYSNTDDAGNNNQGTAYFSDGKMFGDFSVTQSDGTTLQSNVLRLDNTQYVWDRAKNEGYKIDLSVIDAQEGGSNDPNQDNGIDQDQEFEFKCVGWDVDNSMFEVPSDVNFIDNTAALEGFQQNSEQLMSACANITDTAQRTACEQAVGTQ